MNETRYILPTLKIYTKNITVTGRNVETLQGDLLSVRVSNAINVGAGTWSASLVYRLDESGESFYEKKISSLDFVEIKFANNPKMVGIVDYIGKKEVVDVNGAPQRTVTMNGRAIIATLQHDNVYFLNPQIEGNLDPVTDAKFLQRTIDFQIRFAWNAFYQKAPQAAIRAILNQLATNIAVYFEGKEYKLSDFLNVDDRLFSWKNVFLYNFPQLTTFQGSIWNWIGQIVPKPFFEIYTDFSYPRDSKGNIISTEKAVCNLYLRPAPFDLEDEDIEQIKYSAESLEQMGRPLKENETFDDTHSSASGKWGWNKCRIVSIPTEDMVMDDTGKSHLEAYSIYEMIPNSMFFPQNSQAFRYIFPPIVQADLLHLYGARNLTVPTSLVPITKEGLAYSDDTTANPASKTVYDRWRDKLYLWFSPNADFRSGTFKIKGNEDIHPGNRVIAEWQDRAVYYCEQVDDDWSFGDSWITTLHVTRGMDEEVRKKFWDNGKKFLSSKKTLNSNPNAEAAPSADNPVIKPNPVQKKIPINNFISFDSTTVVFELAKGSAVFIDAVNLETGIKMTVLSGNYSSGKNSVGVSTASLQKGSYYVRMFIDGIVQLTPKNFTKQ